MNAGLRRILDAWSAFLSGPDSRYVLNDSDQGWLGERAKQVVGLDQFEHDPDAPYAGFGSWNEFFTRRFKDGARPVAAPDDDGVITNGCESTPYRIATGVQRTDDFWIKREPYSLHDMLAGDPSVDAFVGGTVYQAFLSATNYHRWHSPVRGTVRRAFVQPGTYYSQADAEGSDAVEPTNSQSYLAHVATRAVILIDADNSDIGLVAVVPIGMLDVSTCVINPNVTSGYHLTKGEELGHFQFGGSTYCMVFRAGAVDDFSAAAIPQPNDPSASPVLVRSKLAVAASGG
jgi:phosphatidylserine decarboxylase